MREIKFRAWDEKNREMVYNINLLFSNHLNECFEEYEECGLKIMQYTGLIDKNGVEIYEGDILKIQTSDFYSKKIIDKYIAQVCFSRGGFFVLTDGHHTDFSLWGKSTETMEVIGNIYADGHLLKK